MFWGVIFLIGNEVVLEKLDGVKLLRSNFAGLLVLVAERRWYGFLLLGGVLDFHFEKVSLTGLGEEVLRDELGMNQGLSSETGWRCSRRLWFLINQSRAELIVFLQGLATLQILFDQGGIGVRMRCTAFDLPGFHV